MSLLIMFVILKFRQTIGIESRNKPCVQKETGYGCIEHDGLKFIQAAHYIQLTKGKLIMREPDVLLQVKVPACTIFKRNHCVSIDVKRTENSRLFERGQLCRVALRGRKII